MHRAIAIALLVALSCGVSACKRNYRIGEYVLVQWKGHSSGQDHAAEILLPAYITEKKSEGHYRVHYDGLDGRWDEVVTLDRIRDVLTTHMTPPPPPDEVREFNERAAPSAAPSAAPLAAYRVGDHVRVRWRGTKYDATIRGVVSNDEYVVHYEGYEDAYDEKVGVDRILGKR